MHGKDSDKLKENITQIKSKMNFVKQESLKFHSIRLVKILHTVITDDFEIK